MDQKNPEITVEIPPFLRVHKNGTVERLTSTETVPPGLDSETNVVSKDITIIPETGVKARLYHPNSTPETTKLPLVIYLHGRGFMVSAPADPLYHNNTLNKLVAEANVVAVSVDYRLVPEHPLPAAYEDSWTALQWVASHASEDGKGSEKHDISAHALAMDVTLAQVREGWTAPYTGWLKLNTDGSCNSKDISMGVGGMMRDHSGTWIMGFLALKAKEMFIWWNC